MDGGEGAAGLSLGDWLGVVGVVGIPFGLLWTIYFQVLGDPGSRDYQALRRRLEGTGGVTEAYRVFLRRLLGWAGRFYERRPNATPLRTNPWSLPAFDRCLYLAVLYPLLAALVSWLLVGSAGPIGPAIGLPSEGGGALRFAVAGLLLGYVVTTHPDEMTRTRWMLSTAMLFGLFGVLSAVSAGGAQAAPVSMLAIVFALVLLRGAGGLAAAVMLNAVIVLLQIVMATRPMIAEQAGRLYGLQPWPRAVLFLSFLAVIAWSCYTVCAVVWQSSERLSDVRGGGRARRVVYGVALASITVAPFAVAPFLPLPVPSYLLPILITLALVPAVNAAFDWLSVGLTRWALRRGLATASNRRRVAFSLLDLACALIVMLGLIAVLVFALELLNAVALRNGAESPPVPVERTLDEVSRDPWSVAHVWLYFVLFTTLLPTAVHVCVAVMSLSTVALSGSGALAARLAPARPALEASERGMLAALFALQWLVAAAVGTLAMIALGTLFQRLGTLGAVYLGAAAGARRVAGALFGGG